MVVNWLPVSWQTSPDRLFSSELRVYVINRTGVLAAVAAAIASTETNIDHVSIDEQGRPQEIKQDGLMLTT